MSDQYLFLRPELLALDGQRDVHLGSPQIGFGAMSICTFATTSSFSTAPLVEQTSGLVPYARALSPMEPELNPNSYDAAIPFRNEMGMSTSPFKATIRSVGTSALVTLVPRKARTPWWFGNGFTKDRQFLTPVLPFAKTVRWTQLEPVVSLSSNNGFSTQPWQLLQLLPSFSFPAAGRPVAEWLISGGQSGYLTYDAILLLSVFAQADTFTDCLIALALESLRLCTNCSVFLPDPTECLSDRSHLANIMPLVRRGPPASSHEALQLLGGGIPLAA